ncbi:MAG: hypothetical protein ACI4EG_06920 [Fusicatenibacter sp.]|nr:hypothetical protein [Fusicatenibacter sp.]
MKKYVFGFLAVILVAVLTGGVYAGYTVKRNQNSAKRMGYNLVIENGTEEEMLQVTVCYETEGRQMEAVNARPLSLGEQRYYQIEDTGALDYRVLLQVPGEELVEANLHDDFGKDQIYRYRIEEEKGVLVLKK